MTNLETCDLEAIQEQVVNQEREEVLWESEMGLERISQEVL